MRESWIGSLLRSWVFRAAISAGLVAFILTRLDLREMAGTLSHASVELLLLGVLIFLICNMASVLKWRLIVRTQGPEAGGGISLFHLTSLFYIGLFFNNFLPTSIGGDVVRSWKLARVTGRAGEAAGSVVMDRASSSFALLLIALAPALVELRLLGPELALLVLAMFVITVVFIGLFASERAARRLGRFPILRKDSLSLRRHLKNFYYSLHEFRNRPGPLAAVLIISLVYQGLHILSVYALALSLDIHVSVLYYFLFMPVVLALGMIPISINGIGVREAAWVLLFGEVGVAAAQAFSLSVLSFLMVMVVSLAGGVFYLFDRYAPAPEGEANNG